MILNKYLHVMSGLPPVSPEFLTSYLIKQVTMSWQENGYCGSICSFKHSGAIATFFTFIISCPCDSIVFTIWSRLGPGR